MKRLMIFIMLAGVLLNVPCIANDKRAASDAVTRIQSADQKETAEQFERLRKTTPIPKLTYSQERVQLVKRLTRFNVADKISYIYLINYGKIMGFFTVKGKVSSVNSKLTCTQQLVADGKGVYGWGDNSREDTHVVDSPDFDGSYGSNGNAVFFFNDADIYVEWNGRYMLSDQYIAMAQSPMLVISVDN